MSRTGYSDCPTTFACTTHGFAMIQAVRNEAYFASKVSSIYDFGNNPTNHNHLLDLFFQLWNFSHTNRVYVNDIDFREAFWDGPRRCIFEVDWIEADDWATVENIPISAEKYSEWTALIIRAAETVSYTIHYPVYRLVITRIHWLSMDRFAVEYSEDL